MSMNLSFAGERIIAVMAHPDDAELLCAGTLARAKLDGAAIAICVMCQGDKGVASSGSASDLGATRRSEAHAAADVLGAQLLWYGARDGELFEDYEHRRRLIEIFRQFKPTLVITHAPADYHADHRATASIAEAASWFCASRGHLTNSPALDSPPALWWCDTLNMSGFEPHLYIDVSPHVELKQRMLECHRSQLQRSGDGDFAALRELMMRQCQTRGGQAGVAAAEAFAMHHAFKRLRAL
jgi:N-acetylglucosamine malate deacetylase 1